MKKPLIGLSTNLQPARKNLQEEISIPTAYIHAVVNAGGIPCPIPAQDDARALRELFDLVDGLILIGGRDVSQHFYNQPKHNSLKKAPAIEDHAHLSLARWAAKTNKPLLAICRGHQILNVALGGNLIQDIPSSVPDALGHTRSADHSAETFHPVHIRKDSRLADLLQKTDLEVNSSHHQAVDRIGEDLVPTAWAPDNVLEAMELEGHAFGISVQWHPERILQKNSMHLLFQGLIDSSSKKD